MYANPPAATTLTGLGGVWVLLFPVPAFTACSILSIIDEPVSTPPDLLISENALLMASKTRRTPTDASDVPIDGMSGSLAIQILHALANSDTGHGGCSTDSYPPLFSREP